MTSFLAPDLARQTADNVYAGITAVLSGWQVDTSFGNGGQVEGDEGGYVYALKPLDPNDIRRILAFRGTEISLTNVKDLYADLADIGKKQFADLRSDVNTWLAQQLVEGNRVELVGHSLGGALVQWAINDTNMLDTTNPDISSVLERARTISNDNNFQIGSSQLHFTTFNAPGISFVPGVEADRTSHVVGEHHVVIGSPPYLQGDIVHLLGGPHVGGEESQILAHRVEFSEWGSLLQRSGIFAHTISIPEYFDSNLSPVIAYTPPYLNVAVAQSFAANFSKLGNTDGTVDGNLEAMARLGLFALASGVGLGANTVALAAELAGLPFDRTVFANIISQPVEGINRGLTFLTQIASEAGQNVVDFSTRLSSGVVDLLQTLESVVSGVLDFITETVGTFLVDVANGIHNAVSESLQDVQDTHFDLNSELSFTELKPFTDAYATALDDPRLDSTIRAALEEAQSIVQQAGQTVVIQKGIGPNPFGTTGFNPDAAPPVTVNANEGQLKMLTINLPFEAGVGGQRLTLTLSGPNASGVVVRTNGLELSPNGNTFTLTIPEGQQHLVVGLQQKHDIGASSSLTVTVQLVDANETATHNPDQEATITLADTGPLFDGTVPAIDYGANGFFTETITLPPFGSWITERVGSVNYIFIGGQGSYSTYAGPGNDQLYGGPRHDLLSSRSGNDLLQGFGGNDSLYGWEDDDVLQGGDGNDQLFGDLALAQAGEDYLDGGAGDDLIIGGAGDDVLLGGVGNDTLMAEGGTTELIIVPPGQQDVTGFSFVMDYTLGAGDDFLDGGDGNDTLLGFAGADTLLGGDDIDLLVGDYNGDGPWNPVLDGEDFLDGGAGNDTLCGGGLADVLIGGTGDDVLYGEELTYNALAGEDWLEGGDGNDQLFGGLGDDALFGGIGEDWLVGDFDDEPGADDALDGGAGNDELQGGGGDDLLLGGTENDRLFGQAGDDRLYGDSGDDELQGAEGNDALDGGAGLDVLFGEAGDDLLFGGDGNDGLDGGDGNDELDGGIGDDLLFGRDGNDTLFGEEGDDQLHGGSGLDLLAGGAGADLLIAGDDNDQLFGEDGNDELQGGTGNDVLSGDAGNDRLFGEAGADTLFGDDGADVLVGEAGTDYLEGGVGNDYLEGGELEGDTYRYNLGDGADVIVDSSAGNVLEFGAGITAESLRLGRDVTGRSVLFVGGTEGSIFGIYAMDTAEFADGTTLGWSTLLAQLQSAGILTVGTGGNDLLQGDHQADEIRAGNGNDRIIGLGANDQLFGEAGIDQVFGGEGDDVLSGGEGDDALFGDSGADQLDGGSGVDQLDGGLGNDTLFGGSGNDWLQGSEGADVVLGGLGNDRLEGGAGDDTYLFSLSDGFDVIVDATAVGEGNTVRFGSGIDGAGLQYRLEVGGLALRVGSSDDGVVFGFSNLGDIYNQQPVDRFRFADGTTLTHAQLVDRGILVLGTEFDDFLFGTNVRDLFTGGAGNDTLGGGTGNDRYVFNVGDGVDSIQDVAAPGQGNELVFGPGIASTDLSLGWRAPQFGFGSSELVIRVGAAGDAVTLDQFNRNNVLASHAVESYLFADGSVLSYGQLLARGFDLMGTDGNEVIGGTNIVDRLTGMAGNDVLQGGEGNDLLDGGVGNDQLHGGTGDDTYLFGRGSGQDRLIDLGGTQDAIRFAADVAPGEVQVAKSGRDVVLTISGTNDQITLTQFLLTPLLQIDEVRFADGTVWDAATVASRAQQDMTGTDGADTLQGTSGDDVLRGLGGNDVITGLAGNDVLDGGDGADTLTGGAGDDTYLIDSSSDVVTEVANEGIDSVLTAVSYQLSANVENLTLTGTANLIGTGNEFDNVLTGNSGANVLSGGMGNDTYVVGAGDTVVEDLNEGIDTVQTDHAYVLGANVEHLTLTGSASVDGTGNDLDNVLTGNSAVNVLIGGKGNDTYVVGEGDSLIELAGEGTDTVLSTRSVHLAANVENLTLMDRTPNAEGAFPLDGLTGVGNELDNVLVGNRGANVLEGGAGNDTLNGGAGSDLLLGGIGEDLYLFGRGSGADTITDFVAGQVDTIQLAADITSDDLILFRLTFPVPQLFLGIVDALGNLTGDSLSVTYAVPDDLLTKQVRFADGTVWDGATLLAKSTFPPPPNPGVILTGTVDNDVLLGGVGDDQLIGLEGDDQLEGQDGNDLLDGGLGSDLLLGGSGDDSLVGGSAVDTSGNDVLVGGAGRDQLRGAGGQDSLDGGAGNDWLLGWGGNDTLLGGSGHDHLNGGIGDDVLDGGAGNDQLIGEQGADTYLFGRGSGQDIVTISGGESLAEDTIRLAPGILPTDVIVATDGFNMRLQINGTDDFITAPLSPAQSEFRIGRVVFEDGTVWDSAFLLAAARFVGTAGADTFYGTSGADTFRGGQGDDLYKFIDYADTIVEGAGEGIDTIEADVDFSLQDSVERLVLSEMLPGVIGADPALRPILGTGNQGDNVLIGNSADNILDGGAGDDLLIGGYAYETNWDLSDGNDLLIGGAGDDVLQPFGGTVGGLILNQDNFGADVLLGGAGNDTYVLYVNDGLNDIALEHAVVVELSGEGSDTLLVSRDYVLGQNLENLTMVGGTHGVGNELNNVLVGNAGANVLEGMAGGDTVAGGQGDDMLSGGSGNDTYFFNLGDGLDTIDDVVSLGEGNRIRFGEGIARTDLMFAQDEAARTLTIQVGGSGTDRLLLRNFDPTNANGSLVVTTLAFADGSTASLAQLLGITGVITGTQGHDTLTGTSGNDTIIGGTGNDALSGGAGNDTYVFNPGDGVDTINDTSLPGEGNTLQFEAGIESTDLSLGVGSLLIRVGTNGDAIHLTTFDPTNVLGPRTIETFRFADGMIFSYDQLIAQGFDLTGTAGNDSITGTNVMDRITALAGDDILIGGHGDDDLQGGAGNDTYRFNLGDGVDTIDDTVLPGADNRVQFGAGISQSDLLFTQDEATRTLTIQVGTGGTDRLVLANFDPRRANGSLVVSELEFADGNVVHLIDLYPSNHAPTVATPLVDQPALEDAAFTFTAPTSTFADVDLAYGDVLTYRASLADGATLPAWLNFDAATRTFSGTPGNIDVGTLALTLTATDSGNLSVSTGFSLSVQNVNDAPTLANPIVDQAANTEAAFTFTVAANTFADVDAGDVLTYSASRADGTALPTWLTFNSSTRTFSGMPGAADAGVLNLKVTAADSGNLSASDLFDVAVTIPNLVLTGTSSNDVLTGGAGNDQLFGLAGNDLLTGQAGNDRLDGGTGADTMRGGTGNDTYIVDVSADIVTENLNEGTDTVQSAITYTLGANVENLTLTGTAAINGTGNALNNILIGNSANNILNSVAGNDRLDGGLGSDMMVGGAGDDTYVVNQVGDVVSETAGQGTDTVESSITFTLGSNVENLILTGTANIHGTGSSANNALIGNSGNNILNGGSGNDTVQGEAGNDTLLGGSGNDVLHGGDGIDFLDGGSGDDQLRGGAGNDMMTGGSGADQFTGGIGNDTMTGGSGNDVYNFAGGDGQDTIIDSDPFVGNQDRAVFGATIDSLDLVISRQANDLRLVIHGSADQVTVKDWYSSGTNRIEAIQAGNGEVLLSTQVDQLIQAMAAFTQQNGLTWDQAIDQRPQEVQAVLAASWQ